MARTSKRRQQAIEDSVMQEQVEVVHKTAIYARLSREDNLNNSDSIDNQIAFLEAYIRTGLISIWLPHIQIMDLRERILTDRHGRN